MAHTHGTESGNAHTHRHSDNCEEELSAKYAEYVGAHLEELRAECRKINICVDELLADENIITIVNGFDLNIKKTCRLVYQSGSNTTFKNCTHNDREHIHNDFEDHLTYQLDTEKPAWKNVAKCLERNYGNSTTTTSNVQKICGLANNRTQICSNMNAHKTVRDFFNDQIHHLKCTCKALQTNDGDSQFSMPVLIASLSGGILLLFILIAIGFVCYRRRKSKKRQKQAPNVIYVQAPNSDNYPVYQEIIDDKTHPGYKQPTSLNPPSLPVRYTPMVNSPDGTHFTAHEDSQGYLEPAATSSRLKPTLPLPGQANLGYGIPSEYTQDNDKMKTSTESNSFEPADDEDKGYDTLGRNKTSMEAPRLGMVPLGPVPAKRTKKDDRLTESHYFELETDGNKQAEPEY